MPYYRQLHVEGIPFFRSQSFDLGQRGLSIIMGLNTNGTRSKDNANAVGKSFLLSQIPDLLFPAGLGGKAKDKAVGGTVSLAFDDAEGAKCEVTRTYKGTSRTEHLRLLRNGDDVTPATPTAARKLLAEWIGRDEVAYQVTDYLDNTRPHPLRTGDTAVRRAFFTEFFRLAAADHFKKLVEAERNRLKQDASILAELTLQLANLDVPPDPTAALEKAQSELAQLNGQLTKLRAQRDLAAWCQRVSDALPLLASYTKRTGKKVAHVDDVQDVVARVKARCRKARDTLDAMREHAEARSALAAWRHAVEARRAYLSENDLDDFDPIAVQKRIDRDDAAVQQHQQAMQAYVAKRSKAESVLQFAASKLSDARLAVKTAKDAIGADCPTCGQPMTREHAMAEIRRLQKLEVAAQEVHASAKTVLANLLVPEPPEGESAAVTRARHRLSLWQRAPHVPRKPEVVAAVESDQTEEQLATTLERGRAQLQDLRLLMEDTEHLTTYLSGARPKYSDAVYDKLLDDSRVLSSEVARLTSEQEHREQVLRQRKAIKKRMAELEDSASELEDVLLLEKACANASGIKSMAIRGICAALEGQVNRYAKFLFPEDYVFKFDLDTQFDLTVTRVLGKKTVTSDVRRLSGAEAGLFNLLLSIALVTFLPPALRSNVLILDELNANFSPAMTDAFIRFLPVLNKAIPHIIVITPQTDVDYGSHARYYTVVKKGAQSKLFHGRPTALGEPV